MRVPLAWVGFLLCLGSSFEAKSEPPPRLAVIPYLTLDVTPDEERELREVLSIEVASGTSAHVLSSKEVQKKISTIPDGCPENPTCVSEIGTPLNADYLLFVALVKNDSTIDVQLFLTEVAGSGAMRQAKISLRSDDSTWSEASRDGLRNLFGGVKRLALKSSEALTPVGPAIPNDTPKATPPTPRKLWPWFVAGGGLVLSGASVVAVVLYPFTTLDSFGPGVNP